VHRSDAVSPSELKTVSVLPEQLQAPEFPMLESGQPQLEPKPDARVPERLREAADPAYF
jgi:hypothetical protein